MTARMDRTRRRERGLTLIEMLLALAILGFILLGILPLFMGSVKSNFSANEYTSIHNLSRDRLEQLMNLRFDDPQLAAGAHNVSDLPPVLPDPKTGVPPLAGGIANPFTLTYQVRQFHIPDAATVPNGQPFTPDEVVLAGLAFQYKRIDVTVVSGTGPLGIGARRARVAGILQNPAPAGAPCPLPPPAPQDVKDPCFCPNVICSVVPNP